MKPKIAAELAFLLRNPLISREAIYVAAGRSSVNSAAGTEGRLHMEITELKSAQGGYSS